MTDGNDNTGAASGLSAAAGFPEWEDKATLPKKRGWYITRDEEGNLQWRAWGNNAWWIQKRDGWLRSYYGDGSAMDYDWIPSSRRNVQLDVWDLPSLENEERRHD